jgi:hypothetical protein
VRDNTPRLPLEREAGHLSIMDLVLFDIDGTLTLTALSVKTGLSTEAVRKSG